jgi:transposase InsO family protein
MTPVQKRALVTELCKQDGVPLAWGCRLLGLARSSYYYQSSATEETAVKDAIREIARRYTTYGSRRITQQLRRVPYWLWVNRKRVQRFMRLYVPRRPSRSGCRTTDSEHGQPRYPNLVKDLCIERPDQVWVSDITYVRLCSGFVYLAVIMDVFTRVIRGWQLCRTLDGELTTQALDRALAEHRPEIHHSDQGIQYAAHAYVALLEHHQVRISMAARGQPIENSYAERVIRTIKEEEVYLSDYADFADARWQIGQFIDDVYNVKRIHSALGYLTPAEFERRWCETPTAELSPLA